MLGFHLETIIWQIKIVIFLKDAIPISSSKIILKDDSSLQICNRESRKIIIKREIKAYYRNTVLQQPNTTLTMCYSATGVQFKA